jgi:NMD protein affecting ribosome stability and mRNA decay
LKKLCRVCGEDISGYRTDAKVCRDCARKRHELQQRLRYIKLKFAKEFVRHEARVVKLREMEIELYRKHNKYIY